MEVSIYNMFSVAKGISIVTLINYYKCSLELFDLISEFSPRVAMDSDFPVRTFTF